MILKKPAMAGTLESSDVQITLRPNPNGGVQLNLRSDVMAQFGDAIRDTVLEELKKYDSEDVYVIGGESVYRQLLPYCDVVHATRIDMEYQADAHFPNLEKDPEWIVTADSDEQTYFDIPYTFVKYERSRLTVQK